MSMMDELRAAAKRETGEDLVVQIRIIAADPPVRSAGTKLSATTVEAEPADPEMQATLPSAGTPSNQPHG
jgi:hypothetical protein